PHPPHTPHPRPPHQLHCRDTPTSTTGRRTIFRPPACLQLRGQAGERQLVRRPEVAVVGVGGGPIAGCMLLTS
ncbi:hypothetical protein, partial [Mycobacterium talmoniae]|uniref:hypothetical protein n=1 Tax=Mycobacterium talmoniae TaxID=1858794 RepID=UPI000A5F38FD